MPLFSTPSRSLQASMNLIMNKLKACQHSLTFSSLMFLEISDIIFCTQHLNEIFDLYHANASHHLWKEKAAEFLRERATKILNTPLCYTQNQSYSMNVICMMLASVISPDNKYSLLSPTVASENIFGTDINSLQPSQFIFSDDLRTFISYEELIEISYARIFKSESDVYLTTTLEGEARHLSQSELKRLGSVYTKMEYIRHLISQNDFISQFLYKKTYRVYDELIALRLGLLKGDAEHTGEEYDAGIAAYIAITKFRDFFEKLEPAIQVKIKSLKGSSVNLEYIFQHLFRDPKQASKNDGSSTQYCLQVLGLYLDNIISCNIQTLRNITVTRNNEAERLKNQLLQEAANARVTHTDNVTLDSQIEILMQTIKQNLNKSRPDKSSKHEHTLIRLCEFITSACRQKIIAGEINLKLTCYLNLLLAMGFESHQFNQRSGADNILVLAEICKRITLLSSCETWSVNFSSFNAHLHWGNWLNQHIDIRDFVMNAAIPKIKSLNDYIASYTLGEQTQIVSDNITRLRVAEAEQSHRLVPAFG